MANFIAKATANHKGAFRTAAKRAGKSTAAFADQHAGDKGTLGKRARLAKTLMKLGKHKKSKPAVRPPTNKQLLSTFG